MERGVRVRGGSIESYRLPLDEGFRERLRFMSRLLSVMWLAEAHERGREVANHMEWVRNAFTRV
jgi:hypothetical protein